MYQFIIKDYVNKLTIEDVENYAYKNSIKLDKKELSFIFNLLKKDWLRIYNDDKKIFEDLKKNINKTSYDKIINLYQNIRIKYKK